ncbi:hypothetical protein AY599_07480 [Leptolyngbya valderiana BDU 20041]|nr:hypothetical protein AY599_07480 [Leptolyngbya valderiana BDU 20041]
MPLFDRAIFRFLGIVVAVGGRTEASRASVSLSKTVNRRSRSQPRNTERTNDVAMLKELAASHDTRRYERP